MKRIVVTLIFNIFCFFEASAQLYATFDGQTTFFSSTPLEDIVAENKSAGCILNVQTGEIAVSMRMNNFSFPNKLMQEHFNENYVESLKYPTATFKGKLTTLPDFSTTGQYNVVAIGTFTIHGVSMPRELRGKIMVESQPLTLITDYASGNNRQAPRNNLTVENAAITLFCDFDVAVAEHKIKVPRIMFVKIAKVIKVKNKFIFKPYKKS